MFAVLVSLLVCIGTVLKLDLLSYSSTVSAVVQLLLKGCVRFGSFLFQPHFGVKDFKILQCDRSKDPIFQCSSIVVTSSLWQILTGQECNVIVNNAEVNCLMDDSGVLHIVQLLQDIGYMEETKAAKRPDFVVGGERVEVSHFEIARPTFAADIRLLMARILVPDGVAVMPSDAEAALGKQAVIYAAIGAKNIKTHAKEGKGDAGWIESKPTPNAQADVGTLTFPLLAEVKSDGLHATLRCWRTGKGFLLQDPIKARLKLTQALTTCCLAKITPLLQYIAEVKDAADIVCELTPLHMHWPCETISLRLEPMRLYLHCRKLLRSMLHAVARDQAALIHSGALEAWTSGIEAKWWREGFVESHRMDIVIGLDLKNTRRMHCAIWGRIDTAHDNATDMTLGLPGDTLAVYGIKDVPKEFMLVVKVTGTAQNPQVDWARVGAEIAKLYMHRAFDQAAPFFKGLLKPFKKASNPQQQQQQNEQQMHFDAGNPVIEQCPPPPTLPLPWQEFAETERPDEPLQLMSGQANSAFPASQ